MTKLLALIFVTSLMVGLSVLVMTYGWGLKPQSWWWIIGGGIVGHVVLREIADAVVKADA